MTPAARIACAIDLIGVLEEQCFGPAARRRPADAVASDFFRTRRFIGGGDRRVVSELAWGVVRQRIRLGWHLDRLGVAPTARLLLLAQMLLGRSGDHGRGRQAAEAAFDDSHYGPSTRPSGGWRRRWMGGR